MAVNNSSTISLQDVMGNPMDMIKPMLSEIQWLFGTVYGWAFLAILLCIAVAIIKSAYGSITQNAATKQAGQAAAIEIVAIVFIGIVATAIVIYLFNTFIFG
jgi:hypothetical protein